MSNCGFVRIAAQPHSESKRTALILSMVMRSKCFARRSAHGCGRCCKTVTVDGSDAKVAVEEGNLFCVSACRETGERVVEAVDVRRDEDWL